MEHQIDIVIPWVDGNDPDHRTRRYAAMGGETALMADDTGGDTRFANMGELRWTLASINRFMPWVRKIYIVTDHQRPEAELAWVSDRIADPIAVEIVDHTTVFRGYEDLIPVFNCNSIETMIWRIPGLADHYIYFNDDTFAMAPMSPADWFDGESLVVHGHRMSRRWGAMLQRLRQLIHGAGAQGFKTPMLMAAATLESDHFIYHYHCPLPQSRVLLERFYQLHPELLRQNASYKFRDPHQYNPQTLCCLLAERENLLRIDRSDTNLFLKPKASRPDYLQKRLPKPGTHTLLQMGCINSLDRTTPEEQARFSHWICNLLEVDE